MTRKEEFTLKHLKKDFSLTDCYTARDEAWKDLQDFAEKHGYGSRFCSLEHAMQWLMSSNNEGVRMKTLKLYGRYCAATADIDSANHIGQVLTDMGL